MVVIAVIIVPHSSHSPLTKGKNSQDSTPLKGRTKADQAGRGCQTATTSVCSSLWSSGFRGSGFRTFGFRV